jgi:hypothetical protein
MVETCPHHDDIVRTAASNAAKLDLLLVSDPLAIASFQITPEVAAASKTIEGGMRFQSLP